MTARYRRAHVDPLGLAWPRCKRQGCRSDAALGGKCPRHGGTNTLGVRLALFLDWPDDSFDTADALLPQRGVWQAWVVAETAFARIARDGLWPPRSGMGDVPRARSYLPGAERAPQPIRADAARRLLGRGLITRIALLNELALVNRFMPGLELPQRLLPGVLALVRYAHPLGPVVLAALAPSVELACQQIEAQRRALGLPVFARKPALPACESEVCHG